MCHWLSQCQYLESSHIWNGEPISLHRVWMERCTPNSVQISVCPLPQKCMSISWDWSQRPNYLSVWANNTQLKTFYYVNLSTISKVGFAALMLALQDAHFTGTHLCTPATEFRIFHEGMDGLWCILPSHRILMLSHWLTRLSSSSSKLAREGYAKGNTC